MSRLLTHVGPHKTATTAIQSALASRLGSEGPAYAQSGRENWHAHWELVWEPVNPLWLRDSPLNSWDRLKDELKKSDRDILLSHEDWSLDWLAPNLEDFLTHIESTCEVVITARPLDVVLRGLWIESIRQGSDKSFDEATEILLRQPSIQLGELARRFLSFPMVTAVSIVCLPRHCDFQELLRRSGRAFGINRWDLPSGFTPEVNISLSWEATEALRTLNSLWPTSPGDLYSLERHKGLTQSLREIQLERVKRVTDLFARQTTKSTQVVCNRHQLNLLGKEWANVSRELGDLSESLRIVGGLHELAPLGPDSR